MFSSASHQETRISSVSSGGRAFSIPLNIAEGSGEYSKPEKARFYRIARRSATECAAALDILEALDAVKSADLDKPRDLLNRIVAMLTVLTKEEPSRRSVPRSPRQRFPGSSHPHPTPNPHPNATAEVQT